MKIRLTEGQYKRIFLVEQEMSGEQRYRRSQLEKDCPIPGKWNSAWDAPRDWTLKDPFKDGYDYQWKVWGDCERHWIRKSIKNRGNKKWGMYDDNSGADLENTGWKTKNNKKLVWDDDFNIKEIKKGDPIPKGYRPYYTGFIDDNEGANDDKLYKKLNQYRLNYYDKVLRDRKVWDVTSKSVDYKGRLFDETNEALKGWGWPIVGESSKDYYMYFDGEDIPSMMINQIGFNYLREIEDYKSRVIPMTQGCRYVYFFDIGDSSGTSDRVLIESLNPDGTLKKYDDKRTFLPSNAKYPWMCYFTMGNVKPGKNLDRFPSGSYGEKYNSEVLGVHNWYNWFEQVYGTGDIDKIKNMIYAANKKEGSMTNFPCVYKGANGLANQFKKERGIKSKGPGDVIDYFGEWIDSWDAQDWADLASVVLYLIPTPLTWGLATAIEIGNATVSVAKGNYGEAAFRAGFLVGGFALSKVLGKSYKVSKESAEELMVVLKKLDGKSEQQIAKILKNERHTLSSEAKQLLDDLTKQVGPGKKSELVNWAKKNKEFTKDVQKFVDQGDRESVAVRKSIKKHFGENMYHKIWKHVAPGTKLEAGAMAFLYSAMLLPSYLAFKENLMKKGATEEQIKFGLSELFAGWGIKNEKDADIALNKCNKSLDEFDGYGFIDKLPIYDKFTKNCTQNFKEITDVKLNDDISKGGISVDAGGNYDYKIYPDIKDIDSWVYVKDKNSDFWKMGNCKTTEKVFKTYCKTNETFIDTSEGQSCIEMLGGEEWEKAMAFISLNYNSTDEISIKDIDGADEIIDMAIDFVFN
jgi:hypothetical protein